jgi:hypothetical protein
MNYLVRDLSDNITSVPLKLGRYKKLNKFGSLSLKRSLSF